MIGIYLVEKQDDKMSLEYVVKMPSFLPLSTNI